LESELFGHVKGAFTGAINNKKGLFAIADGGTIFLDEIGEMPLSMQVKLLRVLQEGLFRPVGANHPQQVNVRVIASTNRDLAAEVRAGTFREDLYFRINVFQITPPPLRQRLDDIPLLATHFLEKLATKTNRPVPSISPSCIDLLMRFHWPGNVRELENEMDRALTMAAGEPMIREEFLSDKIRRLRPGAGQISLPVGSGNLKETVRQVERQMICQDLEEHGGNRLKAAQALGLSRQGLFNKINAYEIKVAEYRRSRHQPKPP
jgi:transcriptional regulator with PAS, ATPase and Fis domain